MRIETPRYGADKQLASPFIRSESGMRIETHNGYGFADSMPPSSAQRAVCELKLFKHLRFVTDRPFIRSESGMRIETHVRSYPANEAAPLHPLRERYAN